MKLCILAPHPDDEVLGCGGTIARRASQGWEVDVIIASSPDVTSVNGNGAVSAQERIEDARRASALLGANEPRLLLEEGRTLGEVSARVLVGLLDRVLEGGNYSEVLFPYASHHQEHRLLHDAAFSALRPRPALRALRRVGVYEYPWIGWDPAPPAGGSWYVDIADQLEAKLEAVGAYRNLGDRGADHPISASGVRALAGQRGMECGAPAAELFRLLRVVE